MIGLLDLIEEQEDAIAYDLICLDLRLRDLGTERLTFGDLRVIVKHSPRTSALFRAKHEDAAEWSLTDLLLAGVFDALQVANWQRGNGKKSDRPKPIQRPGVEPSSTTYGKGAIPIDDMAEWLGW